VAIIEKKPSRALSAPARDREDVRAAAPVRDPTEELGNARS
jgi:hypothetical protein